MNKFKRALISMIVVMTVFCLTIIFSVQFPFFTAKDEGNKSDEAVATESDSYVDNTQDSTIQSFSYTQDQIETFSVDQYLASEEIGAGQTDTTTGQDNSLTADADATGEASEQADGTSKEQTETSVLSEEAAGAADDTTSDELTDATAAAEETANEAVKSAEKKDTSSEDSGTSEETAKEEQKAKYANIGISVAKDYVNIRKEPNTEAEVLGKLYRNSAATILKTEGDWYYVESGTVTGYIKAEFMKTGIPDDELVKNYGTQTAIVDADGLNVRKEPSTEAKKLTVIYQNEKYPVVEVDGDWVQIKINDENISGFVKTEFVEFVVAFEEAVSKEEEQKLLQLQAEERAKKETEIKYSNGVSYTDADVMLLACLIHAEAGGQSYEGKLAVANVVLNRVKSSKYPDSIKSVIYQSGQFSVAKSGSLQKQLDSFNNYSSKSQKLSIKAAIEALEGANNIGKRMYFHTYKAAAKKGYTSISDSVKLGDHLFW